MTSKENKPRSSCAFNAIQVERPLLAGYASAGPRLSAPALERRAGRLRSLQKRMLGTSNNVHSPSACFAGPPGTVLPEGSKKFQNALVPDNKPLVKRKS